MDTLVLDQMIFAGDASKCETFFETMPESQRQMFAPRAVELLDEFTNSVRDIRFGKAIPVTSGVIERTTALSLLAIRVAVLSTCPLAELKKWEQHALLEPEQSARIMLARNPAWLPSWCNYVIQLASRTHWLTVSRLEQAGVKIKRTSRYWLGLYNNLPISPHEIAEQIRNDSTLRDEIWDMLNDHNVIRSLSAPDLVVYDAKTVASMRSFRESFPQPPMSGLQIPVHQAESSNLEIFSSVNYDPSEPTRYGSDLWRDFLVQLANEKLIDRERLVQYSFAALLGAGEKKSFKSIYQPFSTAHFAISLNKELTKDTFTEYAKSYVPLIGVIHKDVAIYALNTLIKMHTKFLNCADICHSITPAFFNKDKLTAELALTLLDRLTCQYPKMKSVYGPAILSALGHTNKSIQHRALDLLDRSKTLEDATLRKDLFLRTEMLTGLEKTKAVKLFSKFEVVLDSPKDNFKDATKLGAVAVLNEFSNVTTKSASVVTTKEENSIVTASDTKRSSSSKRLALLNERALKLNPALLSIVRLEEAVQSYESGAVLDAPLIFDSSKFPSLTKHIAVKPISDLDNLIYTLLKVASGTSAPMELETALDGISRMCVFPSDSKDKAQALWEKAKSTLSTLLFLPTNCESALYHDRESFHRLMAAWIHRVDVDIKKYGYESCSFFSHRCHAVQRRVIAKQPAGLLALPTHSGGWIDPEILVERIMESSQMELIPDEVDVIQALLRIATEGRSSALRAASALKGEVGAAVRYALGGEREEIITPAYWVAAFRAREPWGTSEELKKILPNCGPDGATSPKYKFDSNEIAYFKSDRYSSLNLDLPDFLPVTTDDPSFPDYERHEIIGSNSREHRTARQEKRKKYFLFPTVLLHDSVRSCFSQSEAYIWVHNRESLLALYAKRLLGSNKSTTNYFQANLELLFDPNVSLNGNGRYGLCFAMSSGSDDLRLFAVDALIAAVRECRIDATTFGEAITQLLPTKVLTPRRLVRALREVARVSSLHVHFVWQTISFVLNHPDTISLQHLLFLELLVELQIDHAFKPDKTLGTFLISIRHGGKRGKLASAILSHSVVDNTSQTQAALESIEARIRIVERWQNC